MKNNKVKTKYLNQVYAYSGIPVSEYDPLTKRQKVEDVTALKLRMAFNENGYNYDINLVEPPIEIGTCYVENYEKDVSDIPQGFVGMLRKRQISKTNKQLGYFIDDVNAPKHDADYLVQQLCLNLAKTECYDLDPIEEVKHFLRYTTKFRLDEYIEEDDDLLAFRCFIADILKFQQEQLIIYEWEGQRATGFLPKTY